jgi:outer membrane protein OmpA-like peptidoglycan-associated protein
MRSLILLIFFFTMANVSNAAMPQNGMSSAYTLLEDAKKEGGETYAPSVMKEAIFFYEQAERELKNGNNKRAEEFRLISEIRSRTAISIARKKIYENELQRLNSEIDETNSIKKAYEGELRKNVASLEQIKDRMAISQDRMLSSALDKLEKASGKIKAAEDVSSEDFNPSILGEARQTYNKAEENLASGEYQRSIELSEKAIALGERAYNQSKAKFKLRSGILNKLSGIYNAQAEPVKDRVKVSIYNIFAPSGTTILFDAFPSLDVLVRVLAEYPNLEVTIDGYTNEEKSQEENIKLAQIRVETVKDYLVSKGISSQRFRVMSPDNGTPGEDMAKDPRIEVIINLFYSGNT